MRELVRYDAACLALSKAKAVDEAKEIHNVSDAMRAYARQAKNKQLEIDATEIRIRAERRIGELMRDQKDAGLMASGKEGKRKALGLEKNPSDRITLAEVGIDKPLADRARKYAAVPEKEWEAELGEWRERVSAENTRVATRLEKRGAIEIRETPDCGARVEVIDAYFTCPTCGQKVPQSME